MYCITFECIITFVVNFYYICTSNTPPLPPLPSTFLVSTSIRGTGLLEEMQEHKLQTKHRNFKTWKSSFEQEK